VALAADLDAAFVVDLAYGQVVAVFLLMPLRAYLPVRDTVAPSVMTSSAHRAVLTPKTAKKVTALANSHRIGDT